MINLQLIDTILQIAEKNGQDVFLVGGYIRDMILASSPLRRGSVDYDLAVSGNALAFSQDVALAVGGHLVILDEETQTARIICQTGTASPSLNIDIAALRGTDIIHDLQLRDITVNALAVNLCDFRQLHYGDSCQPAALLEITPLIIDPLNGLDDLKQKRIQLISRQNVIDDPLRMIRAVRFSAQLQFSLSPESKDIIHELSYLISTVAIERVIYELLLILGVEQACPSIILLDNLGLLEKIIPEIAVARGVPQNEFHHLDVWNHSLQTLSWLEETALKLPELFPDWHHHLLEYLQEEISGTSRFCLLKLASLLHDIGKPACISIEPSPHPSSGGRLRFFGHDARGGDMVETIGIRLKLSARQTEGLKAMVTHHMRPGYLVEAQEVTNRAVYRFFKAVGEEGVAVLLLSLADRYATRGPASSAEGIKKHYEIVCYLLDKLYSHQPSAKPPRLINGHDLMEYLSLPPSPLIGKLLQAVEEEIAEGRITDRTAALEYARMVHGSRFNPTSGLKKITYCLPACYNYQKMDFVTTDFR